MRRTRIVCLLWAVLPLSCALFPKATPPEQKASYRVHRLAAAPKIDGDVRGDPAWRAIPGASGFRVLGGDYAVAKQSTARAGWTNDALFVAVDCEEPDIALVGDKLKDGEELWKDNGVEIFLEIPGKPGVFQLVVNTIGSHAMGEGSLDIRKWQAAAVKGKDFWSLEAKIPFACLDAAPTPGTAWHGAFCRNIWEYKSGGDKFTTLPALTKRFREPEHFASLTFCEESLSPEKAGQTALKLNGAYRRELARQVAALAKSGLEYEGPIAQAAASPQFQAEAADLNQAWSRIKALAKDTKTAPLGEIRLFVARATDLRQRSYEIKYRYLIEKLFE